MDFSVSPSPLWVNLGFELGWIGLGWDWVCGDLGLGSKNPRKGVVYWLNPKLSLSIYTPDNNLQLLNVFHYMYDC